MHILAMNFDYLEIHHLLNLLNRRFQHRNPALIKKDQYHESYPLKEKKWDYLCVLTISFEWLLLIFVLSRHKKVLYCVFTLSQYDGCYKFVSTKNNCTTFCNLFQQWTYHLQVCKCVRYIAMSGIITEYDKLIIKMRCKKSPLFLSAMCWVSENNDMLIKKKPFDINTSVLI